MKIVSWNVYRYNKKINYEVIDFLEDSNADIICLQEFPKKKLYRLRKLKGYKISHFKEYFYYKKKEPVYLYSVILSKFDIEDEEIIEHKKFKNIGNKILKVHPKIRIQAGFIEFRFKNKYYRLFNLHLECRVSAEYRVKQFEWIISNINENRYNIICGDFNTFSDAYSNFINYFFTGVSLKYFFKNESNIFNEIFMENKLQNPIDCDRTFKYTKRQLDYILVPEDIKVVESRVNKDLIGSDHFPIEVEIKDV